MIVMATYYDITPPGQSGPEPREPDRLLAFRDQFPILARTNYLISNSLGAVPAAAGTSL
jgi:hypothetical protein